MTRFRREIAKLIVTSDRFQKLPLRFDVHEWAIMQDFSHAVESDGIREDLLRSIHGAGAFRHFKDTIRRHGIEADWFEFRAEALRQIATTWCEENQIVWELGEFPAELLGIAGLGLKSRLTFGNLLQPDFGPTSIEERVGRFPSG